MFDATARATVSVKTLRSLGPILGLVFATSGATESGEPRCEWHADACFTEVLKGSHLRAPTQAGNERILALTLAEAAGGKTEYFVLVTQERVVGTKRKSARLPLRFMKFYASKNGQMVERFRYESPDHFRTMYLDGTGNKLITEWTGGSAGHTVIFAIEEREIRLVLWLGWASAPVFLDLDGDGEAEVLHAVSSVPRVAPPEIAEIYKWTGREYILWRTVPWAKRFELR